MYLRNLIASSVFFLARPSQNSRRLTQLARQFLPYALYKRKTDGRFLVLNRQYKPLGFPISNDHFFDYESDEFLLLTLDPSDVNHQDARPGAMAVMLYQGGPWYGADEANEYRKTISRVLGMSMIGEGGEK